MPNAAPPSSVAKAALPATVNPLPSVDPISDPASFSVLVNKSRPLNPASYAPGDLINARGSGQYLRAEAAAWLNGLFQGAADAGTGGLSIVSGYRSAWPGMVMPPVAPSSTVAGSPTCSSCEGLIVQP